MTAKTQTPDLAALRAQLATLTSTADGASTEAAALLQRVASMLTSAEQAEAQRQQISVLLEHGSTEIARREQAQRDQEAHAQRAEREQAVADAEAAEAEARQQVELSLSSLCAASAAALAAVVAAAEQRSLRDRGVVAGTGAPYASFRSHLAGRIAFQLRTTGKLATALDHSTPAPYQGRIDA